MQSLQSLIDMLSKRRGLHINVLDLTGVLNMPLTQLSFKNIVHSKEFCNFAKQTDKGNQACLNCKRMANTKAVIDQKPFHGHCVWGIYEVALPVIKNGSVAAVVYVGNVVIDEQYTNRRIERMCRHTGGDERRLKEQLTNCERIDQPSELIAVAEVVADYLLLVSEQEITSATPLHWMVSVLKNHADELYYTRPTLKEIAATYHKNEKYIGRIFKKEMGVSFSEYCLNKRLEKAKQLLTQTGGRIIDVALESGFDNISYFNRTFKKRYLVSPTEYLNSIKDKKPTVF